MAQGGVDVLFFRAVLSAMVGCTSKLEVLGIYTFSQRSCILSAHRGLQGHTNWKTPEQGGLVLLPEESIRLVSDVSWHPRAVQRRTTHAQRYPGYVLALRHIPTWIFTIFVQYFHRICFGGDIIRKSVHQMVQIQLEFWFRTGTTLSWPEIHFLVLGTLVGP